MGVLNAERRIKKPQNAKWHKFPDILLEKGGNNMRLWHQALITKLPDHQLLGQHRECCALRGKAWGKKHATVDYVFKHPYSSLYLYHTLVMNEMDRRGFHVDPRWRKPAYRGLQIGYDTTSFTQLRQDLSCTSIYPEHDLNYLLECLKNLRNKGVHL